jgi:hypothetical protein
MIIREIVVTILSRVSNKTYGKGFRHRDVRKICSLLPPFDIKIGVALMRECKVNISRIVLQERK